MASAAKLDAASSPVIGSRVKAPAISPQIKSWIDNVIVPGLVDEFLSLHAPQKKFSEESQPVVTSRGDGMTTAEGIQ